MTPRTLLLYLFGNRQAIETVAASRAGVWLGLMFVLSAGFAREYDGEYLLREPWHLLIPLGASLATSLVLYLVLWAATRGRREPNLSWLGGYRSFLTCYWMTAPLAWLYAIPFERMMEPAGAVRANLVLLAVVAAWRVALIIRVIQVLWKASSGPVFCLVMWFADSVLLAALFYVPKPIVQLMGGVRMTEAESLVATVTMNLSILSFLSWPLWAIAGACAGAFYTDSWRQSLATQPQVDGGERASAAPSVRISLATWVISVLSLLVWAPLLPLTQPDQALRWEYTSRLKQNDLQGAIELMSQHQPSDFPPHWDPPPRPAYDEWTPSVVDMYLLAHKTSQSDWVISLWRRKYENAVVHGGGYRVRRIVANAGDDEFDRHFAELEQEVAQGKSTGLQKTFELLLYDDSVSEARKDRIRKLLDAPEKKTPETAPTEKQPAGDGI